jgi:hypothetical protein
MADLTEDDLRAIVAEYDRAKQALVAERDAELRAFRAAGWRPVDIQRITGYSRETIRQALKPAARQAANQARRKPTTRTDDRPALPYGERRPYTVAESLNDLDGPTGGVVKLPRHLNWSGTPVYDLDAPGRLASMYRAVLSEAVTVADLNTWLNRDQLVRMWPDLQMPPKARRLWEERLPELATAGGRTAA